MGLLTPGYWQNTYFAKDYWHDGYWQDYGAVTEQVYLLYLSQTQDLNITLSQTQDLNITLSQIHVNN
jgi:hypothetical protein